MFKTIILFLNLKSISSLFHSEDYNLLQKIDGYGCWCFLLKEPGHGKGDPVDELDKLCKILQDGYECVLIDSEEFDDEEEEEMFCDPWMVEYEKPVLANYGNDLTNTTWTIEQIISSCQEINKTKTKCSIRTCIIENYFLNHLKDLYLMIETYGTLQLNDIYKHEFGFDTDLHCTDKFELQLTSLEMAFNVESETFVDSPQVERKCCGSYPKREPYLSFQGSENECCGEVLYDPHLLKCCDEYSSLVDHACA